MRTFDVMNLRALKKTAKCGAYSLLLIGALRGIAVSLSSGEAAEYSALKHEYSGLLSASPVADPGQWRALVNRIAVFRKELVDKDAFDDVDYLAGLCYYQAVLSGGRAEALKAEGLFKAIAAEGPAGGELSQNASFMLGRVYERMGWYEKAFAAYSDILEAYPREPVAAKAQNRAEYCLSASAPLKAKFGGVPPAFTLGRAAVAVRTIPPKATLGELSDVKIWSGRRSTRFVIEFKGEPGYVLEESTKENRITLVFRDTQVTALIRSLKVDDGLVKMIRIDEVGVETRLTILLDKPEDSRVFPLYEPFRVIIDLDGIKKERPAYIGPAGKVRKPAVAGKPAEANRRPLSPLPSLYRINTIVLDPGHGGRDPGGVGRGGLKEKDLNLSIALKLKEMLSRNPAYEVFLTRERDLFVPLEQRASVANGKDADIFISIHANAAPRSLTDSGFETYYLGQSSDGAAGLAAEYENGKNVRDTRQMLPLLRRLKQAVKGRGSLGLASFIQQELVSGAGLPDRGVKTAPFAVLVGTRMPAVLAELGFLSNPEEEKLLRGNAVRQKLAKGLYRAIEKYSGQEK